MGQIGSASGKAKRPSLRKRTLRRRGEKKKRGKKKRVRTMERRPGKKPQPPLSFAKETKRHACNSPLCWTETLCFHKTSSPECFFFYFAITESFVNRPQYQRTASRKQHPSIRHTRPLFFSSHHIKKNQTNNGGCCEMGKVLRK